MTSITNDNSIQDRDQETTKKGNNSQGKTQTPIQKLNELLAEMDIKIDKAARTASSKQEEIEEYCSSLRCKVDAHSETMIEEIRKWNEKMRDEINDYERQCLDTFNAEEFKASSDLVKSTLSQMNDLQSRIRQQFVDAQSENERINDLIAEASSKLVELKNLNYRMRKIKFIEFVPDFDAGKKEFDPSNGARLVPTSMVSRDRMIQVSTISNMQGFKSLKNCFINPFSSPHELIALVENQSDQMVFVKMDLDGKILKQKTAEKNYSIDRLQTIKQGFMFEAYNTNYEVSLKYFDFDFNEIQDKDNEQDLCSGFTTNSSFIIKSFNVRDIKDPFRIKYTELRFTRHDSSEVCASIKCYINDGRFLKCIASDKHLFVWYENFENNDNIQEENFCLEVFDIEHLKVDQENAGEPTRSENQPNFIDSAPYFAYLKAYGEYIATYGWGCFSLYTQDSKFQLVREYKLDLGNHGSYYEMSEDLCSNGLCLFNRLTGEIYYNFI